MKILPISDLYLFPRHTRATWRETVGKEPPPYNPENRIKRWCDPAAMAAGAPDARITYTTINPVSGVLEPLALTAWEAGTPNLPGVVVYPKRVVAPTSAVVAAAGGSIPSSPINPVYLSTLRESEELAREIADGLGLSSAPAIVESRLDGARFAYVWNGESRRIYSLQMPTGGHSVGLLLERRHEYGLNSPGRWTTGDDGGLIWVSSVSSQSTGEHDLRPEIPFPIRPLRSNESIIRTVAGWVLVQDAQATDRQLLEKIHSMVSKIHTIVTE